MKYVDYDTRHEYEEQMQFSEFIDKIPELHFDSKWAVGMKPPFGGAMIRFSVKYGEKSCSIYLDCHDNLGSYGRPYWEVYPIEFDKYIDTFRCDMDDVKSLMFALFCAMNNIKYIRDNTECMEWIEQNNIDLTNEEDAVAFKLMWG